MRTIASLGLLLLAVSVAACTTYHTTRPLPNAAGRTTMYADPATPGPVQGVGLEAQDIIGIADQFAREMASTSGIANPDNPPRVRIDSSLIHNQSSQRININLFTDRLRAGFQHASLRNGFGIDFVSREHVDAQLTELELRQRGVLDDGTLGSQRLMGVDYRLQGRIMDQVATDSHSGMQSRFISVMFELKEEATGRIVWIGQTDRLKAGADDVIYR